MPVTINDDGSNLVGTLVDLDFWQRGVSYNVMDYGAVGDGVTDDTAAILAAQAAALLSLPSGANQTYPWQGFVKFPGRTYRVNSTLTYAGVPWVGDGTVATVLEFHGSGVAIDARGADADHRVRLSITDMTIDGTFAASGTVGLALAHNYRSLRALDRVIIQNFPSWGLLFDGDNWILSFIDLTLQGNGTVANGAIGDSGNVVSPLFGISWINLILENNGSAGSPMKAGGIHIGAQVGNAQAWNFINPLIESNVGLAECYFFGGFVSFYGVYIEQEPAKALIGLLFQSCGFGIYEGRFITSGSPAGRGIVATGISTGVISNTHFDTNWDVDIVAEDEARLTVLGDNTPSALATLQADATATILLVRPGQIARVNENWTDVVTFLNSWVNKGPNLAYYKDPLNRVHLRGNVKDGTIGNPVFSLPSGYRPPSRRDFAVQSGGAFGHVIVEAGGLVYANVGTNTDFVFDNVSFDSA